MTPDLQRPVTATIQARVQEAPDIFTLRLALDDTERQQAFEFQPGQFNMLYLFGVGEVAISIVSDPQDEHFFDHSIRAIGRVTRGLSRLGVGEQLGIRGPFGRGWPMREAEGRDLVIVTGGLGCAPLVSVLSYVFRRRAQFGRVVILQGVKHRNDLIWRERYAQWAAEPDTTVALAADNVGGGPHDHDLFEGNVVQLFDRVEMPGKGAMAMLCGPEVMMFHTIKALQGRGIEASDIWVSMERNMHCGHGLCGHCQLGPHFVCRDGPVFRYDRIAPWFFRKGY